MWFILLYGYLALQNGGQFLLVILPYGQLVNSRSQFFSSFFQSSVGLQFSSCVTYQYHSRIHFQSMDQLQILPPSITA